MYTCSSRKQIKIPCSATHLMTVKKKKNGNMSKENRGHKSLYKLMPTL